MGGYNGKDQKRIRFFFNQNISEENGNAVAGKKSKYVPERFC